MFGLLFIVLVIGVLSMRPFRAVMRRKVASNRNEVRSSWLEINALWDIRFGSLANIDHCSITSSATIIRPMTE